jgi:hypothetical protein
VHADDPTPLTDPLAEIGHPVDDAGRVTVCGVALRVTTENAGATAPLPDGIIGLDHIGIATSDSAALVAALAAPGFAHARRREHVHLLPATVIQMWTGFVVAGLAAGSLVCPTRVAPGLLRPRIRLRVSSRTGERDTGAAQHIREERVLAGAHRERG